MTQVQSLAHCQRFQIGEEHGVDYDEIFLRVLKMNTLRLLLRVVATEDLELEQLE